METRSNPFASLFAFMIGIAFLLGVGYLAYTLVVTGRIPLPPAQMTVNGQPAAAPAPRPFAVPPRAAPPQAQPQAAPAQPAEQAQPVVEPTPWEAPGVAAPAGEPMTDEYKATLEEQQRVNANGEVCAPRSGCTKPGSAGPLPWPNGRP